MVCVASLICLALGAPLAYFANRAHAHAEVLETIGGALLVAGIALVGSALPVISLMR